MGSVMETWEWPQFAILAMLCADFGIYVVKHGQPRENYNIRSWFVGIGVWLFIIYKGGFWS